MGGNLSRVYSTTKSIENVNVYIPNLQNVRNYQKLRCYTVNSPILTFNKRYLLQEKISIFEELKNESHGNLCSSSIEKIHYKSTNLDKLLDIFKHISQENQPQKKIDLEHFLKTIDHPKTEVKIVIERPIPSSSDTQEIITNTAEINRRNNNSNTSFKEFADKMIKSYFVTHVIVFLAGKLQGFVNSIPNIFKNIFILKPINDNDNDDFLSKYDQRTKSYFKNILENFDNISMDYQKEKVISDIKKYQSLSHQHKFDKEIKVLFERKCR